MKKSRNIHNNISKEHNLVKRQALAKCNKLLSTVEAISKKHGFDLSCVFGNDGWNYEYINLDISKTENSLQSLLFALITLEFHYDYALSKDDVNHVADDLIRSISAYKEDKLDEIIHKKL